jgi:branched-chain amino acid transport system permease protein
MVWIGLEEGAKQLTEFWHLPLGLLLILIVFVAPRGLASVVAHWRAPTPSKAAQASPGEIA